MCRMWNKYEETVDHIVSGCPKQIASIDMTKQQHTYIGRCARAIISKHQKNGMTTPQK